MTVESSKLVGYALTTPADLQVSKLVGYALTGPLLVSIAESTSAALDAYEPAGLASSLSTAFDPDIERVGIAESTAEALISVDFAESFSFALTFEVVDIAESTGEALTAIDFGEAFAIAFNPLSVDIALGWSAALAAETVEAAIAESNSEALRLRSYGLDLLISWVDRSEVGGLGWEGAGSIPALDGATHEVDVLDATGAVVRTLSGAEVDDDAREARYKWDDVVADLGDDLDRDAPLTNPGAENGDLTGWTLATGTMAAVASQGDLTPRTGSWMFGGPGAGTATIRQDIKLADVPGLRPEDWIDNIAEAVTSAWQANSVSGDQGQIILRALDGSFSELANVSTPLQEISPVDTWEQVSTSRLQLAAKTRYLRVELTRSGPDVAFDDVEAVMTGILGPVRVKVYRKNAYGRGIAVDVVI